MWCMCVNVRLWECDAIDVRMHPCGENEDEAVKCDNDINMFGDVSVTAMNIILICLDVWMLMWWKQM